MWFLITGDEQLLCEIEVEWDRVSLQTGNLRPVISLVTPPTTTAASTSTSAAPISTSHEDTTTPSDATNNASSPPTTVGSTPTDDHSFQVDQGPHQVI